MTGKKLTGSNSYSLEQDQALPPEDAQPPAALTFPLRRNFLKTGTVVAGATLMAVGATF